MPLYQRLPKRGFTKPNRKRYAIVNLGSIQTFVEAGKIDVSADLDEAALVASGLVRRVRDGVRVLGHGELTQAVRLRVTGASAGAVQAVRAAGGSVTLTAARPTATTDAAAG